MGEGKVNGISVREKIIVVNMQDKDLDKCLAACIDKRLEL